MFKFELGDIVKDRITSFQGVVTSRIDYIAGCVQYSVRPQKLNKDGEPIKDQWIDEANLIRLNENILQDKTETGPPGGTHEHPPQR